MTNLNPNTRVFKFGPWAIPANGGQYWTSFAFSYNNPVLIHSAIVDGIGDFTVNRIRINFSHDGISYPTQWRICSVLDTQSQSNHSEHFPVPPYVSHAQSIAVEASGTGGGTLYVSGTFVITDLVVEEAETMSAMEKRVFKDYRYVGESMPEEVIKYDPQKPDNVRSATELGIPLTQVTRTK